MLLNRTRRRLIRGIGRRGGSDSGRGPPRGGGGFVSRRSQKHELTPDEHLFFVCMCSRDLFGNALLFVVVSRGGKDVFAPAPQYLKPHINTRSVCLFLLLLFGVRRGRGESSFSPNRERRRSSSKKKSKSRDSEKKQKKKRTTLFFGFFFLRDVCSLAFWTARTKGFLREF